jgi:capsular exopolysaccharide synthesis family protein
MEKIAIAVQRARDAEQKSDVPLGPTQATPPALVPPGGMPRRIVYTRTPTVPIAPRVLERHRVTSVNNDITADPFRMLRTQVLMQMRQNGWQTLALTSPNKGAGKSTVSLNLAIGFAMEVDYTALLVDADLRDPDVRNLLELEPGPGLADYLMGKAKIEDLLIHPAIGNLVVLPGGAPVTFSSELMRSPMMADMIREFRARYRDRLIVFDVPPILSGADTLALSTYMDATILLVEESKTRKDEIERSVELLKDSNLIGIVLNKSRELPEPDPIARPEPGFWQRIFGMEA